jgi:hypothetical protein
MRDQKALYFIAAFLGFLVLYCLMNHSRIYSDSDGFRVKINVVKTQPGVVTQL